MGNTRFGIGRGAQEEKVNTLERIAGWLMDLHIDGSDEDVSEIDNNSKTQKENAEPATPPRKGSTHEAHDELSPTDTSFSGPSVFDSPLRNHGQPGRLGLVDNKIRDELSDITSTSGNECSPCQKKEQSLDGRGSLHSAAHPSIQSASIVSYKPPTGIDEEFEEVSNPIPSLDLKTRDPSQPRLVWVASCLQCTLAGLSCSRTTPACSRCKRKGNADVCLLQRRWFLEEIAQSIGPTYTLPILLKLKSEDEEIWRKKLDLAEKVCSFYICHGFGSITDICIAS